MARVRTIPTLILTLTLALSSCREGVRYHRFSSLPQEGWSCRDTLCFVPDSDSIRGDNRFWIEVRLDCDFPYASLPLTVEQRGRRSLQRDSLIIPLTNDGSRLNGRGLRLLQYRNGPFDLQPGTKEVRIWHNAGYVKLIGIRDLGLEIRQDRP